MKEKRKGHPRKTSKLDYQKLKSLCFQNGKHSLTVLKTKWVEASVDVCARTVGNRHREMGFSYRMAKRKPALRTAQKKKCLQ